MAAALASRRRAGVQAWRDRALCAEVDPELWFPEPGGDPGPAKRICARCPVRSECLAYALEAGEKFGVFGGMTAAERVRLRRRAAA